MSLDLLYQLWKRPRYLKAGAAALEKALTAEFEGTTLNDVWRGRSIALAIPAIEMSRHRAWVFKTPHLCNTKHRDDDYRLVDVCLATTAAPVYRSLARIKSPGTYGCRTFADGGLWANSPVLVGLIDALGMTEPGDSIELFCLGTRARPGGEQIGPHDLDRGFVGWCFGASVLTLALDVQEFVFNHMARMISRHVDRDCRIVRFPQGEVSAEIMKHLDLDATDGAAMDALAAQAQGDVDETMSKCNELGNTEGQLLDKLLNELPPIKEMKDEELP